MSFWLPFNKTVRSAALDQESTCLPTTMVEVIGYAPLRVICRLRWDCEETLAWLSMHLQMQCKREYLIRISMSFWASESSIFTWSDGIITDSPQILHRNCDHTQWGCPAGKEERREEEERLICCLAGWLTKWMSSSQLSKIQIIWNSNYKNSSPITRTHAPSLPLYQVSLSLTPTHTIVSSAWKQQTVSMYITKLFFH